MEGIVIKTKRLVWETLLQMLILKKMLCQYKGAKKRAVYNLYWIAARVKCNDESELVNMYNGCDMIIHWDIYSDDQLRKFAQHLQRRIFKRLCSRHHDIPPEKILVPPGSLETE